MTYKPVFPSHDKLRKQVLSNPETRAIYEATKLQIDLSLKLKTARKKKGMSQEEVADLIHTKTPAISRIESSSLDVKHFPSVLTLAKYASAIGYRLNFDLVPIRNLKKGKSTAKHVK